MGGIHWVRKNRGVASIAFVKGLVGPGVMSDQGPPGWIAVWSLQLPDEGEAYASTASVPIVSILRGGQPI